MVGLSIWILGTFEKVDVCLHFCRQSTWKPIDREGIDFVSKIHIPLDVTVFKI